MNTPNKLNKSAQKIPKLQSEFFGHFKINNGPVTERENSAMK